MLMGPGAEGPDRTTDGAHTWGEWALFTVAKGAEAERNRTTALDSFNDEVPLDLPRCVSSAQLGHDVSA